MSGELPNDGPDMRPIWLVKAMNDPVDLNSHASAGLRVWNVTTGEKWERNTDNNDWLAVTDSFVKSYTSEYIYMGSLTESESEVFLKANDSYNNFISQSSIAPPGEKGNIVFALESQNVQEDVGEIEVQLLRVGGNSGEIDVRIYTEDMTATNTDDYEYFVADNKWLDGSYSSTTYKLDIYHDNDTDSVQQFKIVAFGINGTDSASVGLPIEQIVTINNVASAGVTLPALSRTFDGYGGITKIEKSNVYAVTNLNTSGAGSFFAAPTNSYVIFPYISGDIIQTNESSYLSAITNDLRFMGQTSPNGIQLRGEATGAFTQQVMRAAGSDCIFEHLAFSAGQTPTNIAKSVQHSNSAFDYLGINADTPRRIIMSHCSFRFGDDNVASFYGNIEDFSILDCLMAFGQYWSNSSYSFMNVLTDKGTIARNFFSGNGRNPLHQAAARCDFSNNVMLGDQAMAWQGLHVGVHPRMNGNNEKNLMIGLSRVATHHLGEYDINFAGFEARTEVRNHYNDNRGMQLGQAVSAAVEQAVPLAYGPAPYGLVPASSYTAARPTGMPTYSLMNHVDLYNHVLANAGASHNRDSLDQSAIDILVNGVYPAALQDPIESITTFGGYPTMSPPAVAKPDIWDLAAVDKISDATKASYGIPAGTDTTTTYLNGGTSNDFEAIIDHNYGR